MEDADKITAVALGVKRNIQNYGNYINFLKGEAY